MGVVGAEWHKDFRGRLVFVIACNAGSVNRMCVCSLNCNLSNYVDVV